MPGEKTGRKGWSGPSRRAFRISLIAAVTLFLIGGVIDAVIPDKVTAIQGIDDVAEIYIGDQLKPDYKVEPKWFEDEPISFRTGDKEIAAVDANGVVTAEKVGETTLAMTAKEFTREVSVVVVPKVTKIRGVNKEIQLEEGNTKKLKVKLSPEKFADEPIHYKSKDKKVVTVSKKGKLTAKDPGKTTLVISAGGCKKKVSVEVTEHVEPVVTYTPSYSYSKSYRSGSSSGSSKRSGSSSGKSSGKSGKSGGYFKKSDDEYF